MVDPVSPFRPSAARHTSARRPLLVAAAASALLVGGLAYVESGRSSGTASAGTAGASATTFAAAADGDPAPSSDASGIADGASATQGSDGAASAATQGTDAAGASTNDLDGAGDTTGDSCKLDRQSIHQGDTGPAVVCLQNALIAAGYLSGGASGTFDNSTANAVKKLQTDKDMFVDGKVGRETALNLGIWPDEQLQVVRTPIPPAGAKDLLGYQLSSVASSGPDAPPLPANSGTGKRLVYSRINQRVWAVDANERVVRSWLVSGSKYNNEIPGVHKVFSKSETSTAWNGKALLPHMVRYAKTHIGAIGFHGIPRHVSDGSRYQTDAELGTRLSGGCTRQADLDADFVWAFAEVGTTVVVL